jgi:hypothetical protein
LSRAGHEEEARRREKGRRSLGLDGGDSIGDLVHSLGEAVGGVDLVDEDDGCAAARPGADAELLAGGDENVGDVVLLGQNRQMSDNVNGSDVAGENENAGDE